MEKATYMYIMLLSMLGIDSLPMVVTNKDIKCLRLVNENELTRQPRCTAVHLSQPYLFKYRLIGTIQCISNR